MHYYARQPNCRCVDISPPLVLITQIFCTAYNIWAPHHTTVVCSVVFTHYVNGPTKCTFYIFIYSTISYVHSTSFERSSLSSSGADRSVLYYTALCIVQMCPAALVFSTRPNFHSTVTLTADSSQRFIDCIFPSTVTTTYVNILIYWFYWVSNLNLLATDFFFKF